MNVRPGGSSEHNTMHVEYNIYIPMYIELCSPFKVCTLYESVFFLIINNLPVIYQYIVPVIIYLEYIQTSITET